MMNDLPRFHWQRERERRGEEESFGTMAQEGKRKTREREKVAIESKIQAAPSNKHSVALIPKY